MLRQVERLSSEKKRMGEERDKMEDEVAALRKQVRGLMP
jgi:predicted nuclease with TOPRIM domain